MGADGAAPPLPEHPELREFARAMEAARVSGDIVDARWRTVFISSELARLLGTGPDPMRAGWQSPRLPLLQWTRSGSSGRRRESAGDAAAFA